MKIQVKIAGADSKRNDIVLIHDEAGLLWASSHVDLFAGAEGLAPRLTLGEDLTFELVEVPTDGVL